MKITCSANPSHKTFCITVKVWEEWITDEHGEWLKSGGTLVDSPPGPDDGWTCRDCGAAAIARAGDDGEEG